MAVDASSSAVRSGRCLLISLTTLAIGLAGCGGGGGGPKQLASVDGSVTSMTTGSVTASTENAVATTRPASTGSNDAASAGTSRAVSGETPPPAKRQKARLPGPPGPQGLNEIFANIPTWHTLAQSGVPSGQCQPLLDSVAMLAKGSQDPYVYLYRGIAEGCLGDVDAARGDLERARRVGLDRYSPDATCNSQLLLAFGFDNYLDEEITPECPPPTTTTVWPATTTTVY